jgi:hypothetical protein
MMAEASSEQARPYESLLDSRCRSATSELLKAARFMSRDSDRRIFHRFDELRIFVLLRLQHRLAAMATELESLRRKQEFRASRGEIDVEMDNVLNNLAMDIGRVLKDYGMYMCFALLFILLREETPYDNQTEYVSDVNSFLFTF